jgi:tetratricopeptide (TPR) repeat protein
MGSRELKEEALYLYARRRFAECAQTYERLLDLDPRDPRLYLRQAEAYLRAGSRREAINAYRMAAELLMDQGNEARSRAALKVALQLDPRNSELARALGRLSPAREEGARPFPLSAPQELFEFPEDMEQPLAWQKNAPAEPPVAPLFEVRRLSDNKVAMRAGPSMRWWVVSSDTSLLTREVDDLEELDFSLEVTFEPDA